MSNYHFETAEFAISDSGIHLLRSRFNYKTINFSDVSRIRIKKGREIHNWVGVFIFGMILIVAGMFFSVGAINALLKGDVSPRHAKLIFFLFIPLAGRVFVYNSLQTGTILKVDYSKGSKDMFPLKKIVNEKRLSEFKSFLREKLGTRIQVSE